MANVIDKAVNWAIEIANDDTHSYSKIYVGDRIMTARLLLFPHTNKLGFL